MTDTLHPPAATVDLTELERGELEAHLAALGYPRFHASQIFSWIYRRRIVDPVAMTDLPAPLRDLLAST